jgi:hypothetical protein
MDITVHPNGRLTTSRRLEGTIDVVYVYVTTGVCSAQLEITFNVTAP